MKKNRILSLILAVILVASAVITASCGEKTDGEVTKAPSTEAPSVQSDENTEPAATEPEFSTKKYDGDTFTVYLRDPSLVNYAGLYIIPEETDTDTISSAALTRNQRVEERFDITLAANIKESPYTTMKKDYNDGGAGYDLVLDQRRYVGPLGTEGILANFNDLDVNLTTPWWDAKAANQYSVCGKLFIMPCDVSISNLGGVRFFCFNKAVLENFHLTSPYESAAKNEWTLETFAKLVKSVSDPAADGGVGTLGFINEVSNVRNALLVGIGVPWIEKISEDKFEVTLGTSYADRTQTYMDWLKDLITDKTCVMDFDTAHSTDAAGQSAYYDKYMHARGLFATDHFLFVHCNMNAIAEEFAEMSKGFGVIMNPKFNKDQENYYHKMDNNSICFAIPAATDVDPQRTVDIMDYWAYVSSTTVMEAYYEITLKSKRSNEPIAAEMLDTIKGSIGYFISDIYSIDVSSLVNDAYSKNVDTAWKTWGKSLPKQIDAALKKLK